MPITYDPSLSAALDQVRFLIGDTDTTADPATEGLDDGEINYCLTARAGNVPAAAKLAAQSLLAKWTRLVDTTVGEYNERWSQRAEQLRATMADLAGQMSLSAVVSAGGISVAENAAADADTDRPAPAFKDDDFDNRRAPGLDAQLQGGGR